jgi:hypothetical protein
VLEAYWDGAQWLDDAGQLIDSSRLSTWELDDRYHMRRITGLASFRYRFNINIGDITSWPTYDSTTDSATFTLRTIPSYGAGAATPWLASLPPAPIATNDTYTLEDPAQQLVISDPSLEVIRQRSI